MRRVLTARLGDPVGDGNSRLVFRDRRYVVKVPVNSQGYCDNGIEAFKFSRSAANRARCRLLTVGLVDLLVMVRVEPHVGPTDLLPEWTHFVDCAQVGYTEDGRLVAFDYA